VPGQPLSPTVFAHRDGATGSALDIQLQDATGVEIHKSTNAFGRSDSTNRWAPYLDCVFTEAGTVYLVITDTFGNNVAPYELRGRLR
jgi:hypothetical protein